MNIEQLPNCKRRAKEGREYHTSTSAVVLSIAPGFWALAQILPASLHSLFFSFALKHRLFQISGVGQVGKGSNTQLICYQSRNQIWAFSLLAVYEDGAFFIITPWPCKFDCSRIRKWVSLQTNIFWWVLQSLTRIKESPNSNPSSMDTLTASVSLPIHQQAADYDAMSMQEFILFDDSVKDLKNLRTQLYSAAEYFELSYTNDDQKQIVVETLKDYTIKALVNTVDHLGSVTYKVNDVIDEKVEEVSGTELRVSCIEQRLKTCREYTDREGLAQQSSIIDAPRYHKRYIFPAGEAIEGAKEDNLKYHGCTLEDENEWHHYRSAAYTTISDTPSPSYSSSSSRKVRSMSPSLRHSRLPGNSSSSGSTLKKEQGRRSASPHRFPLLRTGSLVTRPATPKPSRSTTPNPAMERQQWFPSRPSKSASVRVHDVRQSQKETQQQPSKSKRLLKALLSRRKSKKDDMLYTYLDEY